MRHHATTLFVRRQKMVLSGFIAIIVLGAAGLPESHAQMRYSGGLVPLRHPRDKADSQPPAPQTASPAAPQPSVSYSPDNDAAYPLFIPGGGPKRSLASPAGGWPYGVLAADLPWNRVDFEDYNEPPTIPSDPKLLQARKYLLAITPVTPAAPADRPENAMLIAHLPEHAVFWVQGTRTRSLGRTRYFQSPPLLPDRKYNYRVSAAWIEDGSWVSQTRMVPVQAGLTQAIFLQPAPVIPAKAAIRSLPK